MKRIILTGGGTAGHVTPNIALLPRLKELQYDIHYIGSYNGIEKKLITEQNVPYYGISTGKLRRYFDLKNLTDPFRVIKGCFEARKLIRTIKPDVVFSKGGFVSVPVVLAASAKKIPCIIHESDMTPGLANKISIPKASKVCCNFAETMENLPAGKAVVTGTPIRQELFAGDAVKAMTFCGFTEVRPTLLVIVGSSGSVRVNEAIRSCLPELTKKYNVIHLCGKGNIDESYNGTAHYVQFDYIKQELADLLALADIVVSRAGANAICEISALHKPNLLIPLSANASRGDQILNARSFEKQGYSMVLEEEEITDQKLLDPKLSAMRLAPSGPYQPYTLASHTDQFESDVRKVLKSEWMYQYDNHLNFPWEVRQWEIVNRYPMAESLVKTGWADALCSQVYDEYEHSTRINLRAETYYGVFGLNRQELAAVSQSKKSFREVDNALEWKEAGLAINGKNMAMTANIRKLSGMAKTLQESGMTRSLKYLRQQTRRATGSYNGQIALQVASDWLDYLDMARQMKMNLNLEKVRFPLDLKRRHDDLVLERNKRRRKDALRGAASSIKKDAKELENQFHIENIYKKIRKIYEYDGAEYIIRVPDGAKAILEESRFLDHCIQRGTRYFERIAKRESYIFFMRRKADPNTPWYTLEVEPGGTVRQKRSYNNDQYADLEDAKPFIAEWQQVVQGRMTAAEIDFARQSKEIRAQEFAELKENGNIIRTGANAGKLLVDELMHDLMEVEKRVG